MTQEERYKLDILSAYTGLPLTEEQKEFACDFTQDCISFSDPGTGKTHTLIMGLLMAQGYHKVSGQLINCMSFTNAAVSEMSGRYEACCKKCGITPTIKFNTFHSLSNRIMREAYPAMKIVAYGDIKQDLEDLSNYMRDCGVPTEDYNYTKRVLNAINELNSSLTFHEDNVARRYAFVSLNMDIAIFQELRKKWFLRGIITNTIVQGDIPLYCLYALMSKPHIIQKWKGLYKIMVVDEFQDLSLLHLHILSYVAQTLIVIGDMKQQIYAFNGACPQIVDAYMKLHPDARICNLTQSFRCAQPIADFATKIIQPNDPDVKVFTGQDKEAKIQILERKEFNFDEVAKTIAADISAHRLSGARNVMFLYRNNASAIPIIDRLYKLGVPFRCPKFQMITDVPIVGTLCDLCNAAWQPTDVNYVERALKWFPEFKNHRYGESYAPVDVIKQTGKDLFSIAYRWREDSSKEILNAMLNARKAIEENKNASVVLNQVLEAYTRHIIKGQWWRFDQPAEFYFNLIAPVCAAKTYPLMIGEELDKSQTNEKCIQAGMGIRLYTIHSAKGLEADDIYILDCDEGMFPNMKVEKRKIDAGCFYDVACDIRSERNLLYVACTRAKDSLTITFSSGEPAKLLARPDLNDYIEYDRVYEEAKKDYDDAAEFYKLFRLGDYANKVGE